MTYPILNTDHENKFQELTSKILDLKNLEGPIYSVESKHHYQEIDKKVEENPYDKKEKENWGKSPGQI